MDNSAIQALTLAVEGLRETNERLITEMQQHRRAAPQKASMSLSEGELRVWLEERHIPYLPEANRFQLQALYDINR